MIIKTTSAIPEITAGDDTLLRVILHPDNETSMVYPGQSVFIPANSRQFIENRGEGDLVFLCIVNPAWRSEDEEVFAPAGCDLRGKWPNN